MSPLKLLFITIFFINFNTYASESPVGLYLKNDAVTLKKSLFQVIESDNTNYIISDIYGSNPIKTSFQDGLAEFDGENFISIDDGSEFNRVYSTSSTIHQSPNLIYPTNLLMNGEWNIEETSHDLTSGEILPQFDGSLIFIDVFDLSIDSPINSLRFNDSNNIYFQGVMLNGQDIVFRTISNPNISIIDTIYATIPGNEVNFDRDVIGTGKILDINHFQINIALQQYIPSPFFKTIFFKN